MPCPETVPCSFGKGTFLCLHSQPAMGEQMQRRTMRPCFITATGHENIFRVFRIYAIIQQQPWFPRGFHLAPPKGSEEMLPCFGEVQLLAGDSWGIRELGFVRLCLGPVQTGSKGSPSPQGTLFTAPNSAQRQSLPCVSNELPPQSSCRHSPWRTRSVRGAEHTECSAASLHSPWAQLELIA